MGRIKKLLIPVLCLLFLSCILTPNRCLPAIRFLVGADQDSYLNESDHCHDQPTPCHNKIPCPDHACCSLLFQSAEPYFILEPSLIEPVGIFLQPFEMAESVFHPPRFATALVVTHFII